MALLVICTTSLNLAEQLDKQYFSLFVIDGRSNAAMHSLVHSCVLALLTSCA